MWSGSTTTVPTGYALCNGATYAKSDGSGNVAVPDLRDRFIVGAGTTYAVGATGGNTSNTPTITMSNAGYALAQNDLPAYNLTVTESPHTHTATDSGHTHNYWYPTAVGRQSGSNTQCYTQDTPSNSYATATSYANISVASAKTNLTVNSAGGGLAHTHNNTATSSSVSTLSPYYALCFIYKL
jgi:hypothetical protein